MGVPNPGQRCAGLNAGPPTPTPLQTPLAAGRGPTGAAGRPSPGAPLLPSPRAVLARPACPRPRSAVGSQRPGLTVPLTHGPLLTTLIYGLAVPRTWAWAAAPQSARRCPPRSPPSQSRARAADSPRRAPSSSLRGLVFKSRSRAARSGPRAQSLVAAPRSRAPGTVPCRRAT